MTTLTFRRPTVLPIHPQSWTRPAGNIDFRVTQRFDVADSYYGGTQKHNAVDLGNFRCSDAVVAMLAGRVRRVQDNATALGAVTNALGLVIDHGSGITSEYWHLNGYSIGAVDGATVAAGQQVASVGRSGLGNVCHLHTEVKVNGVRIDPEPLMFGGSLTIEDDDVKIPANLKHIAQAVVGVGNRLRLVPFSTEGARILESSIFVQVYGLGVKGQPYTLGGVTSDLYAWVAAYGETGYVAEPLLKDYQLTPTGQRVIPAAPADCSAQDATIAQLSTKLARASTSAAGAAQAATATVEALR